MNFPATHDLYGTGPAPKDADALLVLETAFAWIPGLESPRADAKIVWVDPDPVQSRYKTVEFCADICLPVTTAAAASAVFEAATALLTKSDLSRIADRRTRLMERKQKQLVAAEEAGQKAGQRRPLHPLWVHYQVGKVLAPEAILIDDTLGGMPPAYHCRTKPGTYFKSGGSTGGWGSGAAFGAKVARPDCDVVLTSGDGYFMFGTPLAALWCGGYHKAPFLSVVFVNKSYSTGVHGLQDTYPQGVAVATGNYTGGMFDPPPNFVKLAEAANGYGELVSDPDEVGPALRRALDFTRRGTPALVAVDLPTLVQEPKRLRE